MRQSTGLAYDRDTDRWRLNDQDLHCGDGLQVRVCGHWIDVRIEYGDRIGWVLYAEDGVRLLPSGIMPARPDPRDPRW